MLSTVRFMIEGCRHGFNPYIKFQRLWRFRTKHAGSSITGFTILEVMIAVLVITVGVLAVVNLAQNITVSFRTNASRLTATYLAQEGIELVRNQRDTNWLETLDLSTPLVPWTDHIWPAETLPLACTQSDILGKFDRTCTSTYDAVPPEEMEISVEVSWEERGTSSSVTNATKLYNWLSL